MTTDATGYDAGTASTMGQQEAPLRDAASGIADQAGRTAEAQASRTLTQAGDTLQQVAQAVRDMGNGMREQQPQIAGMVDGAAEQVQRTADYLKQHNASDVVAAADDFARRQPAAIVVGGLAIGLAIGRLLRTTATSASSSRSGYGFASTDGSRWSTGSRGSWDTAGGAYGSESSTVWASGVAGSEGAIGTDPNRYGSGSSAGLAGSGTGRSGVDAWETGGGLVDRAAASAGGSDFDTMGSTGQGDLESTGYTPESDLGTDETLIQDSDTDTIGLGASTSRITSSAEGESIEGRGGVGDG
ncbi:MAG: hypothetical protein ACJ77N_07925 [Chloroflexota bacterium]